MYVVETILSSQFAWASVFSSSNLSLKHAYINFSKLSIACCVSPYVQLRAIIRGVTGGTDQISGGCSLCYTIPI